MRSFFGLVITFIFLSAPIQAQEYIWPTNSGTYLSSTFGETRSAHFHAGLDIKTWGREGYEVYATRDGILHRLLVTERGYGNAIYLKHQDGSYTVYAHLQRFNDQLKTIADSIRLTDYSFEMDAIVDTLGIKVRQGDIIGYTGSTGIGPPHLHFEIRDSLQNPVNALTSNLDVKDTKPPVFSSLIVEPLTKNSRVEGRPVSYYTKVSSKGEIYNFGEIRVHGKAGLAVNVYDRADDVYNAYAIYSLALVHRSDTLFYQELNTMSFDDSDEMFLDRIAPFGSTRRGHQRLYPKEGNQNPFYLIESPGAVIQPADSQSVYQIIATDFYGNTSKATVTIIPNDSISQQAPDLNNALSEWYWNENWASPDLQNTLDLRTGITGINWYDGQKIVYQDDSLTVNFARIDPENSHVINTPDRNLSLRISSETFFDTLTVAISHSTQGEKPRISVQPQMLPIKKNYTLSYFLGNYYTHDIPYRLFELDSDGDLNYVDSKVIGKTLYAWPSGLGEFVVVPDSIPPGISQFRVYKTDFGEWRASVQVKDDLSGVNSSSAEFYINGIRGIAEYDYEKETIIYYLPGFTPQTVNTVKISVEDKAGNTAFFSIKQ
ncbi:M23 family metallopeptidase [Gracilimonas tropica]|uniref:M23 family metallopeptidase n=1 Tax=Gracilimonas tropica TaxID=454600 RepID=UPI000371D31E|nr:M23 family metallopeptidase [Gracilimonas tropica]